MRAVNTCTACTTLPVVIPARRVVIPARRVAVPPHALDAQGQIETADLFAKLQQLALECLILDKQDHDAEMTDMLADLEFVMGSAGTGDAACAALERIWRDLSDLRERVPTTSLDDIGTAYEIMALRLAAVMLGDIEQRQPAADLRGAA